jgi:hypothetical protein
MLNPIRSTESRFNASTGALLEMADPRAGDPSRPLHGDESELAARFQDFVAGSFYKTMLKSLRDGQKPPQYFYGGNSERIFQKQFDEQLAETLARDHGAQLAAPFYDLYSKQHPTRESPAVSSTEVTHGLDAFA